MVASPLDENRKYFARVGNRAWREVETRHELELTIESHTDAGDGLIGRNALTPVELGGRLVDKRLCPIQIVRCGRHQVGDRNSDSLLQRSKMPCGDLGFQPALLLRGELDRHGDSLACPW